MADGDPAEDATTATTATTASPSSSSSSSSSSSTSQGESTPAPPAAAPQQSHPHYQNRCPPPLDLAQLTMFDKASLRRTDTVITHPDGKQVVEGRDEEGRTITKSISFGNLGYCSTDAEDLQVGVVVPGLIIGSQDVAHNLEILKRHKVTHILNVASHVTNLFPDQFTYLTLDLRDLPDFPIAQAFPPALAFIQEALSAHEGCVLVHCNAGVSRSATIVLAHLMKTRGMSLNQAFAYLRDKRPSSFPNSGFMIQLKNFEHSLGLQSPS